jgi:hypothetical protein
MGTEKTSSWALIRIRGGGFIYRFAKINKIYATWDHHQRTNVVHVLGLYPTEALVRAAHRELKFAIDIGELTDPVSLKRFIVNTNGYCTVGAAQCRFCETDYEHEAHILGVPMSPTRC